MTGGSPPAPGSGAAPPEAIFQADTVESAAASGLAALGLDREEADVEVLDRGSRGFLGLGARPARVRVVARDFLGPTARRLAQDVLRLMGIPAEVSVEATGHGVRVIVRSGEADGVLIGRKGETLDALQHVLSRMAARRLGGESGHLQVDVAGYRTRRDEQLRDLARGLAERVRRTGRRAMTEPLSAAERRIVHRALAELGGIESHAAGTGVQRRVVLLPERRSPARPSTEPQAAASAPSARGPADRSSTDRFPSDRGVSGLGPSEAPQPGAEGDSRA